MQRAQQLPLAQVPDQLDSPATRYERAYLLRGYVVCRYANSGTLVVVHAAQKTAAQTVANAVPISCIAFCQSVVITLHCAAPPSGQPGAAAAAPVASGNALQVYNVETRAVDLYAQDHDVVSGVRCVLVDGRVIVGIAARRLVIWDRDSLLSQPRSIDLSAGPAPLIPAVSDRSALLGDGRVLLANANPGGHAFQVWDLARGELVAWADAPSKSESPLTFDHRCGLVVASYRDTMYIWAVAPGCSGSLPCVSVAFANCIVTAVHVDAHFVITGDNFGNVSLHTRTGRLVYHLTRDRRAPGDVDMREVDLARLSSLFRARVNRIQRVGRWVVAAFENSRLELYDIFTAGLATPCDLYVHAAQAPVREMAVHDQRVIALLAPTSAASAAPLVGISALKTSSGGASIVATASPSGSPSPAGAAGAPKPKPELVMWSPKTDSPDSFEFYSDPELWGIGVLDIMQQACNRAVLLLKRLEGLRPEDVRHHMSTLSSVIGYLNRLGDIERTQGLCLPFLLYQHLQQSLDAMETYMTKLAKGVRTAKSREHLDDLRASLVRSMELLLCCADFLGDVKLKTNASGTLVPFSEKGSTTRIDSEQGVDGHSSFFHVKRKNLRKALDAKRGAEEEDDDMVDEMLQDVLEDLGAMHEQTNDVIERFDSVCNEGIHDPDKVMPLLSVYTKLRQLSEDIKETGKEVGELRGDDPAGEWWEGGGDYDDAEASATAALRAASPSSTSMSQN